MPRPVILDNPRTYNISLSHELLESFRRACRLNNAKPPVVIRQLMQSYIDGANIVDEVAKLVTPPVTEGIIDYAINNIVTRDFLFDILPPTGKNYRILNYGGDTYSVYSNGIVLLNKVEIVFTKSELVAIAKDIDSDMDQLIRHIQSTNYMLLFRAGLDVNAYMEEHQSLARWVIGNVRDDKVHLKQCKLPLVERVISKLEEHSRLNIGEPFYDKIMITGTVYLKLHRTKAATMSVWLDGGGVTLKHNKINTVCATNDLTTNGRDVVESMNSFVTELLSLCLIIDSQL